MNNRILTDGGRRFSASSLRIPLAVLLAAFCLAACGGEGEPRFTDFRGRRISVLFTTPGYDQQSGRDSHVQDRIAAEIRSARNTLDICIYELSQETIFNAVIAAHERGVRVRFAGDIDNMSYAGYQAIQNAGIPMALGNRAKIMHNKYVIIDERRLITGSMNFTDSGVFRNDENVLFIDSPELCAYYKKDFETMFVSGLFGLDKIGRRFAGYEDNVFVLTNDDGSSSRVEAYFAPYHEESHPGRVDYRFMGAVDEARVSIMFAIFAFTHADIADRMVSAAAARGIRIYGVFDHSWHSANQYALHHRFLDAATTVPSIFPRYDGNENFLIGNSLHGSKCHNKLMVVDGGTPDGFVLTGSFNFSKAASYKGNDENFLIIYDPVLATSYADYVKHLYAQGYHPTRDLGGDAGAWQEVWISEVNWAGSLSDGGVADQADKFIELENRSTRPIDISGWQVTGTAASALSWRILMHIVPRGSRLAPGERFVISLSTNRAFSPPRASTDPFLYLHHPQDQNFLFLTLKDRDGRIIDEAGSGIQAPFAGSQGPGGYASMERIGTNGRSAASWQSTVSVSTQSVRAGYRMLTRATPGY